MNFPQTSDWFTATETITARTSDRQIAKIAGYYGLRLSDLIRYRATLKG